MEINWKQVFIGFILIFILSVIFSIMIYGPGAMIGYLVGTIYIGYAVGGDHKNTAIHGALTSFLVAIFGAITITLMLMLGSSIIAHTLDLSIFDASLLLYLISNIAQYTVVGVIGGIIGGIIGPSLKNPGLS